jgi:hypothetical protein
MLKIAKEKNKFLRYLNQMFKLKVGIERLILIFVLLFIITHITACLFFLIAKLDGLHPETWVVKYGFSDSSNFTVYSVIY